jgi:hypothetical protein
MATGMTAAISGDPPGRERRTAERTKKTDREARSRRRPTAGSRRIDQNEFAV